MKKYTFMLLTGIIPFLIFLIAKIFYPQHVDFITLSVLLIGFFGGARSTLKSFNIYQKLFPGLPYGRRPSDDMIAEAERNGVDLSDMRFWNYNLFKWLLLVASVPIINYLTL